MPQHCCVLPLRGCHCVIICAFHAEITAPGSRGHDGKTYHTTCICLSVRTRLPLLAAAAFVCSWHMSTQLHCVAHWLAVPRNMVDTENLLAHELLQGCLMRLAQLSAAPCAGGDIPAAAVAGRHGTPLPSRWLRNALLLCANPES